MSEREHWDAPGRAKRSWTSKEAARRSLRRRLALHGGSDDAYVYRCSVCLDYHAGHHRNTTRVKDDGSLRGMARQAAEANAAEAAAWAAEHGLADLRKE